MAALLTGHISIHGAPAQDFVSLPLFRYRTVPAAASLVGAGGTHFRTDLTITNFRAAPTSYFTVQYFCSRGCIGFSAELTIPLAPGEARTFRDVVSELFGLPESSGAIRVGANGMNPSDVERFAVSSHTYSDAPCGSVGAWVAGVPDIDTSVPSTRLFVNLATSGGTLAAGYRSNVGIVNRRALYEPGTPHSPSTVSLALVAPDGTPIGTPLTVSVDTAIQIDNIFRALGAPSGPVADAYLFISSDGAALPYVTVIDNFSGDFTIDLGIPVQ